MHDVPLLGEFQLQYDPFTGIDEVFASYKAKPFQELTQRKKIRQINQNALQLLQETPEPCFLLSAIVEYFHRVNQEKLVKNQLTLSQFELWLNQYSKLSDEENYRIRAKIAGKYLPREEYQVFFPVGMKKQFFGTHFVVAHKSPDVDSTVNSFWGWLDSFACRVGEGLHLWSLPGGTPDPQATVLFEQLIGKGVFEQIARAKMTLDLSSCDLLNQKGLTRKAGTSQLTNISHRGGDHYVILTDPQGYYLGDWRNEDVESVRQVLVLMNTCLRHFESSLHVKLISLFAKHDLNKKNVSEFVQHVFGAKIQEIDPTAQFTEQQNTHLRLLLERIMNIPQGMQATFFDFAKSLEAGGEPALIHFHQNLQELSQSEIFDEKGEIIENRPIIFKQLEALMLSLDKTIAGMRRYFERLDLAIDIKRHVFNIPPVYVTLNASIEEIRTKMGAFHYLTVVHIGERGKLYPLGVVRAKDLKKEVLGTVSLRDFCNFEEMQMASYLQVISVIDHHKSVLKTSVVPSALIGDVQSSNVLVAEQAFKINDRYGTAGMTFEAIQQQLQKLWKKEIEKDLLPLYQGLMQKKAAVLQKHHYYIHPKREFAEYISFLYAILDDTDLLNKVTSRDVECVAALLNKMKTIIANKEVETANLEEIMRDDLFAKLAAKQLLKNEDLYSLYRKISLFRQNTVEKSLKLAAAGKSFGIFQDTKEQNGSCRVGQTKIFSLNYPTFVKNRDQLRQMWIENAQNIVKTRPEMDLHLHMISTIAGADEVYQDTAGEYSHQDELWIWGSGTKTSLDRLRSFFAALQNAPEIKSNQLESMVFGRENASEYAQILKLNFLDIPLEEKVKVSYSMIIIKVNPGSINSRKSMITPYLPKLVS